MKPLSRIADEKTVENVFVFITDSLRYDYLPERVSELGVTCETIAASTYTASSIPSMMTGQYPSAHKVWNFGDVLPNRPDLFDIDESGMSTNAWAVGEKPWTVPPMRGLKVRRELEIEDAEAPFVVVRHDKGAHAPYDFFNVEWADSPSFFESIGKNRERYLSLYKQGVTTVVDRFFERLEYLREQGFLEDTLVVFTSDHGELLGEPSRGGIYGHGAPICPELVRVPTVFMGAGIPEKKTLDRPISGADLAPTLIGATGRDLPEQVEGVDLWNEIPDEDRVLRSEFWANAGRLQYGGSSGWDDEGGIVVHKGSRLGRTLYAIHRKLLAGAQAPANRSFSPFQLWRLLATFLPEDVLYGAPDERRTRTETVKTFEKADRDPHVEKPSSEQLRALGYLE